jgi:CBS domain containing-hemolysin-like protein
MGLFPKILLLAALVMLNALFVAAEASMLSVRRTRIEQLIQEGNPSARLVEWLLDNFGLLISGTQLGVTTVSLLIGWLGESVVSGALLKLLEAHLGHHVSVAIAHSVAFVAAFLIVSTLLMVLGELVPKTVAYERSERVTLLVARPMVVILSFARPAIRALESMARLVLYASGRRTGPGSMASHTTDEVKLIVSAIRKSGHLGAGQEEMIHSVFDLHRVLVRQIMVPWPRVTRLALTTDLRHVLDQVVREQHSRIPIYSDSPDSIIGVLFAKDLLQVALDRYQQPDGLKETFDLRSILREPMIVPETMPLSQMLEEARIRQEQMALVVDEFGTYVGLVTIEDVLEQIVGEIRDEYDLAETVIHRIGDDVIEIDASINLRELADDYGIALPRGSGYETLAGFLLDRFGFIPKAGDVVAFEGRRYTVAEMDGLRLARVRVEKLPNQSEADQTHRTTANG